MAMRYTQYSNANDFLKRTEGIFNRLESINGLMYGLCLRLKKDLLKYGEQPLFALVEDESAIYIAALMTPPYKLQLILPGRLSAQSIKTLARGLNTNWWAVPGVMAERRLAESFTKEWVALHKCHSREGMKQRIYELRCVKASEYTQDEFIRAKPRYLNTAIAWARAFHVECFGDTETDNSEQLTREKVRDRELFFWSDPLPVAMAARTRPTPNGESINLVYTPPENRRRGYATSLVAALSQKILDDGKRFCCLYTHLDNPTSNSIYRKIGYVPVADAIDIHFEY